MGELHQNSGGESHSNGGWGCGGGGGSYVRNQVIPQTVDFRISYIRNQVVMTNTTTVVMLAVTAKALLPEKHNTRLVQSHLSLQVLKLVNRKKSTEAE